MPTTASSSTGILYSPIRGRLMAIAILLLNLLVFGLAGFAIYSDYEQNLQKARMDAQNLSQMLQQSIDGSLDKIDASLYSSVLEIERQLASGGINQRDLNQYLAKQHKVLPQADSLRATNAAGDILYGSEQHSEKLINIADRDYFQFLRDHPEVSLAISDPHIGRTSGKHVMSVVRRISNADGSFAGVIFAPITTDVIANILSSLTLGPKGSVSLRKGFDDFAIIVRHPENIHGTTISATGNPRHSPEFAAMIARGDKNHVYEAVMGVDGIYRTFSVRKLEKFNYYVGVGLAHDDVLAGWRNETVKLLAITCVFLMTSVILAWRQHIAWRRQKKAFELLESIALQDGLTGIPNRRRFDDALQEEWLRARREQLPISLIIADIDLFKSYNDHHGHLQGDVCLTMVAKALHGVTKRPGDLVARYGGEEFSILLPNTDKDGAYQLAEHARQLIESLHIQHGFSTVSDWVTISAGVYTMLPTNGDEPSVLIENTDHHLYQAKNEGRNRVCGSGAA